MLNDQKKLHIETFGGLQITLDGEPVTGLISRKAFALLVFLAAEKRSVSRDRMISLLWSETTQTKALGNLSVHLSSLRKKLNNFLATDRHTIGLEANVSLLFDRNELETAVLQAKELMRLNGRLNRTAAGMLAAGLDLYRGDFLAGFHIRDAEGFDEWVTLERARLRTLVFEGFDLLHTLYISQGKPQLVIDGLNRQLNLDPFYEDGYRKLMKAYVHAGQQAEALATYERCAEILNRDLGILPDSTTVALQQEIVNGTFEDLAQGLVGASNNRQIHNIPIAETSFLGRENELALIHKRFDDDPAACRLQTLVGAGGIGKTRLAMQIGRERESWYEDGVAYFSLEALEQADFLASEMLSVLGFERHDQIPAKKQLISHLQRRHMLIILDNFEQLLDESQTDALQAVGLLIELMQRAPDIQFLVTSRERLNIQGEWLVELNGLPYPATFEERRAGLYAAVELFKQRASQIVPDIFWHDAAADALIRICQLVDGHPLALEMAAAQMRVKSIFQISEALQTSHSNLARKMRGVAKRHQSMTAVFDHSWRLLSGDEQQAFVQLSILRRAWSELMGMFLAQVSADLLERLVDQSMLRSVASTSRRLNERTFDIHPLLRQFAKQKLAELLDGTTIMALHKRAAEFIQNSTTAGTTVRQSDIAHHLYHSLIVPDQDSKDGLAPIAENAPFDDRQQAVEYLLQDGSRLFSQYMLSEAKLLFDRSAFIAQSALPKMQAIYIQALFERAVVERFLGDTKDAVRSLETGLSLLKQIVDLEKQGLTQSKFLIELAYLYGQQSEIVKGLSLLDEAGQLLAQLPAADLETQQTFALCLLQKGTLLTWDGKFKAAEALVRESIKLAEEVGADEILAQAWNDLGAVLRPQGEYAEALRAYRTSRDLWAMHKNDYRVAVIENNIAIILAIRDDWAKSLTYFQRALWFWERIEDLEQISRVSMNMGNLLLSLGQWEKSEEFFLQSIDLSKHTGNLRRCSMGQHNLAYLYLETKKFDEAKQFFQKSLVYEESIDQSPFLPLVYIGLAETYLGIDEPAVSHDYLAKAQALLAKTERGIEIGMAYRTRGKLLRLEQTSTSSDIITTYKKSSDYFEAAGNRYERARTLAQLASYYQSVQEEAEAAVYHEMAMSEFVSLGAKKDAEQLMRQSR